MSGQPRCPSVCVLGHPGTAGLVNSVLRRLAERPRAEVLAELAGPDPGAVGLPSGRNADCARCAGTEAEKARCGIKKKQIDIPTAGQFLNQIETVTGHAETLLAGEINRLAGGLGQLLEKVVLDAVDAALGFGLFERGIVLLQSVADGYCNTGRYDGSIDGFMSELAGAIGIPAEENREKAEFGAPQAGESTAGADATSGNDRAQDESLLKDFITEGLEYIGEIEVNILNLEQEPDNKDYINAIFRPFHSVKGVASFLNLDGIRTLPHDLETLLDKARNPIVRARVEPVGGVMVGGPARVVVDVLTPTWFLAPPQFPTLDVPGALVVFEERGVNLNESIEGTSYSGLQRDYLVYPMREGRLEIPSFEVTVVYAIDAKPSMTTPLSTKPLSFKAMVPAAARGLDYFVSATQLRLRQTLEPQPKGLAVGAALRRTVTIEAEGAFGMMLPPLPVPAIAGLSAYPDPPHVEDRGGERGEARVARRVESIAYRLEREGDYELPAIEIAWWDLGARQMKKARLPAVAFSATTHSNLPSGE